MEIIDVTSKIICRLGYDEKTNELIVIFKTGKRYLYSNVSKSEFKAIIEAESIGSAFTTIIKKTRIKHLKHWENLKPMKTIYLKENHILKEIKYELISELKHELEA